MKYISNITDLLIIYIFHISKYVDKERLYISPVQFLNPSYLFYNEFFQV